MRYAVVDNQSKEVVAILSTDGDDAPAVNLDTATPYPIEDDAQIAFHNYWDGQGFAVRNTWTQPGINLEAIEGIILEDLPANAWVIVVSTERTRPNYFGRLQVASDGSLDISSLTEGRYLISFAGSLEGFWGKVVIRSLDSLKTFIIDRVNSYKDTLLAGTYTVENIGCFQINAYSFENLSAEVVAAVTAQLTSQEYSVDWIMYDNSVATLSAADVINAFGQIKNYRNACVEYCRTLKESINNMTAAELSVLDISVGWPPN